MQSLWPCCEKIIQLSTSAPQPYYIYFIISYIQVLTLPYLYNCIVNINFHINNAYFLILTNATINLILKIKHTLKHIPLLVSHNNLGVLFHSLKERMPDITFPPEDYHLIPVS